MEWVGIGTQKMAYVLQEDMPQSVVWLVDRPPNRRTPPHIEVVLERTME